MRGVNMPPRSDGLEGIPVNDPGLTVGKVPMAGVGLRVGMQAMGTLTLMSPAKARRVAGRFEQPEAIAADLGWVAVALREAADEIEAIPHDQQMAMVAQAHALGRAPKGRRQ